MKFHPILFSNPMVAAILNGTKTQTRRTKGLKEINQEPENFTLSIEQPVNDWFFFNTIKPLKHQTISEKPPYAIGDILYVREEHYVIGTWELNPTKELKSDKNYYYFFPYVQPIAHDTTVRYSDNPPAEFHVSKSNTPEIPDWYKRNSLFMPKAYTRLFLEITDIKCERLYNISEADAIAEGIQQLEGKWNNKTIKGYQNYMNPNIPYLRAINSYISLWQSINGLQSHNINPWVFAYTFKVIPKPKTF
jgi:hypothetical protein